jgi:hypothetical protein
MSPSMHSKCGALRRIPVSVVFPEGPEIVHRKVEEVREVSPFNTPQVNVLAVWVAAVWVFLVCPYAGPTRIAVSSSTPIRLIRHSPDTSLVPLSPDLNRIGNDLSGLVQS